jgi:M6 family metalloprotease-like protein
VEEPVVSEGSLPLLVVRLAYRDRSFVNDAATWSEKFFGGGKHQLNHYYLEVSNGTFEFTPASEHEGDDDGVITVSLDKSHPDPDIDGREVILTDLAEALAAADPFIDYGAYDRDGNGYIGYNELQVIFIVAGYEDAYSGGTVAPGIWAHSYCLSSSVAPQADGVSLLECIGAGRYSLFGERHGVYSRTGAIVEHDATVGIIAHELGHSAFLLPDLYDTDGSSGGIGYYGLMGGGSWGASDETDYPGNTPVHPCAWSKIESGWVTPQVVGNANVETVSLNQSAAPSFNIVKVPISGSEYFLLENRDNSGYDRGLFMLGGDFDGGLALWHIDEEIIAAKDPTNTVNNDETHKGVDLEEAARPQLDTAPESGGGYGHESNLYYAGNVAAFTPVTSPDSDSYTGGGSGIYVTDISDRGATMYATVANPNPQ